MNLRFSENAVRVRLSEEEAQRLVAGEALEQSIPFPGGNLLRYSVRLGDVECVLSVERSGDHIEICGNLNAFKQALTTQAAESTRDVGLYTELPVAGGQALIVALEIDLFSRKKGRR